MAPSKKVASSVAAVLLVGCLMAAALFRYDQSVEHGKEVSLLTNEELTAKVAALQRRVSQLVRAQRKRAAEDSEVSIVKVDGPTIPGMMKVVKYVEFRGRARYSLSFDLKVMLTPQYRSDLGIVGVGPINRPSPYVVITRDNRLSFTQDSLTVEGNQVKTVCTPTEVLNKDSVTKVSVQASGNSFRVLYNGNEVWNSNVRLSIPDLAQPFYLSQSSTPAYVSVSNLVFRIY